MVRELYFNKADIRNCVLFTEREMNHHIVPWERCAGEEPNLPTGRSLQTHRATPTGAPQALATYSQQQVTAEAVGVTAGLCRGHQGPFLMSEATLGQAGTAGLETANLSLSSQPKARHPVYRGFGTRNTILQGVCGDSGHRVAVAEKPAALSRPPFTEPHGLYGPPSHLGEEGRRRTPWRLQGRLGPDFKHRLCGRM